MASSKLSNYLVTPRAMASLMDWKAALGNSAIMSLDISQNRIGVAVASHPSSGASTKTFDPIRLRPQRMGHKRSASTSSTAIATKLEEIVAEERVCAFVVRWPLQEGGRMGAQCGKVLHQLDSLVSEEHKKAVIGKNRPFALYDDREVSGQPYGESAGTDVPDEWGRLASFGRVPDMAPDMFYSSRTPYHTSSNSSSPSQTEGSEMSSEMAAKVLRDFLDDHFSNAEDDFLGLNSSPKNPRKYSTSGTSSRKHSNRSNIITSAARNSIDEDGSQAYISPSLL